MQFEVENMTCGSCVKHIAQAISIVDPHAKLEADTVAGLITLQTSANHRDIEVALEAEGYPARLV